MAVYQCNMMNTRAEENASSNFDAVSHGPKYEQAFLMYSRLEEMAARDVCVLGLSKKEQQLLTVRFSNDDEVLKFIDICSLSC